LHEKNSAPALAYFTLSARLFFFSFSAFTSPNANWKTLPLFYLITFWDNHGILEKKYKIDKNG